MAKKPAENVGKLMKAHTKKKMAQEVTVGKRMRLRKQPRQKPAPTNVLTLIARHLRGR